MTEQATKTLEEGKAAKEKSMEEFAARTKGKPTPTQDENDRAIAGEHIIEHEHDGSEVEGQKQMQAKPSVGAGYATRQAQPSARKTSSE
jgi:hypothetical protein